MIILPLPNHSTAHNNHAWPQSAAALWLVVLFTLFALPACSPRTTSKNDGSADKPQSLPTLNTFAATKSGPPTEDKAAGVHTPFYASYADSPIPWQPWSQATLELARSNKRPMLVHLSYSTCPFTRRLQNTAMKEPKLVKFISENFVCVLVDSEQNLALNTVLLEALPPLKCAPAYPALLWLDPDGKPYLAHNFLASNGFDAASILVRAENALKLWNSGAEFVGRLADEVLTAMPSAPTQPTEAVKKRPALSQEALLQSAFLGLSSLYNESHGTLNNDRNFLCPHTTDLYLALADTFPEKDFRRESSLAAARNILYKIRAGAIYDQLDHTFLRYSERPNWDAPHSECLLADQAMMASAYLLAGQRLEDQSLIDTAHKTLDAILADWKSEDGLFIHAVTAFTQDNSTPPPFLAPWYRWTLSEIQALLSPEELAITTLVHGIQERGNMPPAIFQKAFTDKPNILRIAVALEQAATKLDIQPAVAKERLDSAHAKLRTARASRPGAFRDDRSGLATNALLLSALSQAAITPDGARYLPAAQSLYNAIIAQFFGDHGRPEHALRWQGKALDVPPAHIDFALCIQACLDFHETTKHPDALQRAQAIQLSADQLFFDAEAKAYRSFRANLLLPVTYPQFTITDSNLPADNAVAAKNLRRLHRLTNDTEYAKQHTILLNLLPQSPNKARYAHSFLAEIARSSHP